MHDGVVFKPEKDTRITKQKSIKNTENMYSKIRKQGE